MVHPTATAAHFVCKESFCICASRNHSSVFREQEVVAVKGWVPVTHGRQVDWVSTSQGCLPIPRIYLPVNLVTSQIKQIQFSQSKCVVHTNWRHNLWHPHPRMECLSPGPICLQVQLSPTSTLRGSRSFITQAPEVPDPHLGPVSAGTGSRWVNQCIRDSSLHLSTQSINQSKLDIYRKWN